MELTITNCNNIDSGKIEITRNKLNIKFGINGTGKSTITRAIKYAIDSPQLLNELIPFKYRNLEIPVVPEITIDEEIKSVLIFNEEYLNQFLFKEDELISNSYEIFINTPEHKKSTEQIEQLLSEIKKVFSENEDLNKIISDFENLSKSFATTQTKLSKSSLVSKSLKDGNKLEHIPEHLKGYTSFLKDKNCTTWLAWQMKGSDFIDISEDCPYCTSPTTEKKETIKSVSKTYDKKLIENLNIIITAINNLGEYFSKGAYSELIKITSKQTGLEKEEEGYIVSIKNQIETFLSKLKALKDISPVSFNEGEKVEEKLKTLKINIELFDRFKSEKTTSIIESLNYSLDIVLEKVGQLQGEINQQKRLVKILIERHRKSINSFLTNAGYKYTVEIVNDNSNNYKLLLRHIDSKGIINGGKQHLSFGEKNAFSLVLFMYEALYKKPDLIILDDPISSFDKSKKYAIIDMLFGKENGQLRTKSVLMLTHDLDPVIDTVKVLNSLFNNICEANFLTTKKGVLTETRIKKQNLLSFAQICKSTLKTGLDGIVKLIYLRRHFEIIDDLGNEYQIISNLFHKRKREECKDQRKEIGNDLMSDLDFNFGIEKIKELVPGFDYFSNLTKLEDLETLKALYKNVENSYAKLNIFRLIYDDNVAEIPSVLRKFINETFHIENELICQLDPNEYDLIPDFILEECDKFILE